LAGCFGNIFLEAPLWLLIPNPATWLPLRARSPLLAPSLLQPLLAAAVVLLLTAGAEWLHARRVRRLARLAFGPAAAARAWTLAAPFLRVAALTAFAWGLAVMIQLHLAAEKGGKPEGKAAPRLVFVADLSPSMLLKDAGPQGKQSRRERMREEVESILMRVGGDLKYGVIGFYTDAKPIVMDASDAELVRNVFNGLPINYVMKAGSTDLGTAVASAVKLVEDLPERSVRLVIFTDGDTTPLQPVPPRPAAISQVLVLGVGNPHKGSFIDGHQSRQDGDVLRSLAAALRGDYLDINEKHLPTPKLGDLVVVTPPPHRGLTLEEWALLAMVLGAAVAALLPAALELAGTDWRVVAPTRGDGADAR
jgi:Ca-activated chloride channel family protein